MEWKANPANIYLFKVTIKTLENAVKYVQSEQEKQQNDVYDGAFSQKSLTTKAVNYFRKKAPS